MPRLALPGADRDACDRHVGVGFAFPGRPNPFGLVPLEVWLLVHWAPPGKKVRDPKLKFVQYSRFPVDLCRRCALLTVDCQTEPTTVVQSRCEPGDTPERATPNSPEIANINSKVVRKMDTANPPMWNSTDLARFYRENRDGGPRDGLGPPISC